MFENALQRLARHLVAEGHVDNEPDAFLAAIWILSTHDRADAADAGDDE